MRGCVDAWMRGCMDAWMHGHMDGWMHAWTHGWMDACMHGHMDGWMDACMHGCVDAWKRFMRMCLVCMYACTHDLCWSWCIGLGIGLGICLGIGLGLCVAVVVVCCCHCVDARVIVHASVRLCVWSCTIYEALARDSPPSLRHLMRSLHRRSSVRATARRRASQGSVFRAFRRGCWTHLTTKQLAVLLKEPHAYNWSITRDNSSHHLESTRTLGLQSAEFWFGLGPNSNFSDASS